MRRSMVVLLLLFTLASCQSSINAWKKASTKVKSSVSACQRIAPAPDAALVQDAAADQDEDNSAAPASDRLPSRYNWDIKMSIW